MVWLMSKKGSIEILSSPGGLPACRNGVDRFVGFLTQAHWTSSRLVEEENIWKHVGFNYLRHSEEKDNKRKARFIYCIVNEIMYPERRIKHTDSTGRFSLLLNR